MKKILFLFLLSMGMLNTVYAYNLEYTVFNYKTLQPVDNANISIYNSTYEISKLTDTNGYAIFDLNDSYIVDINKNSYTIYTTTINNTNNSAYDVYLTPYSHSGIVRVNFVDLTFSTHTFCLYFNNSRLEGCYVTNNGSNVILHNNMEYTFIPTITKNDIFSNPTALEKYLGFYYGAIIGVIIFLIIISFILYVVYKIIFGK